MNKLFLTAVAGTALLAAGAAPARADVVFSMIPNAQSFTGENIITAPGQVSTGTTVFGQTNQTNTLFSFTSSESLTISGRAGFATIETTSTTDNFINTLRYDIVAGQQFNAFDPLATSLFVGGTGGGTVQFFATAYSSTGVLEPEFSSQVFTLSNGENKFLIDAINGEVLSSVRFVASGVTSVDINEVRQTSVTLTNIPSPNPSPVPEPASLALFGLGLLGLGASLRYRQAR